jgi:hypothetical protein
MYEIIDDEDPRGQLINFLQNTMAENNVNCMEGMIAMGSVIMQVMIQMRIEDKKMYREGVRYIKSLAKTVQCNKKMDEFLEVMSRDVVIPFPKDKYRG